MADSRPLELVVLSNVDAYSIKYNDSSFTDPICAPAEVFKDSQDQYNHPRKRRAIILGALRKEIDEGCNTFSIRMETVVAALGSSAITNIAEAYKNVHSPRLISFLMTAWKRWLELGESGRDPSGCHSVGEDTTKTTQVPALIPPCFPFPRDPHQLPSDSVLGQVAFYGTDVVTPIFSGLEDELLGDAALVLRSVECIVKGQSNSVVYVIPTHPGHHAARDSFGGYCYFNHAAAIASLLSTEMCSKKALAKVAVLDIDYHCGNGTASIFYDDPTILVVSIHCNPNFEYPFHTGFQDQAGVNDGIGATLHIPLSPGATWHQNYKAALLKGLSRISEFEVDALVVSMGLDTYDQDPCALRRAGFCLKDGDYVNIGETITEHLPHLPTIFVQEGGYRMEKIGIAAKDVVISFCDARAKSRKEQASST